MKRDVLTQTIRRAGFLAVAFLFSLAAFSASVLRAQGGPNRVALVVQFGPDATLVTECVTFSEPEITGEELLRRSSFNVLFDLSGFGAAVCSINGTGCDVTAGEPCFCQCAGGGDCTYWSYWHLQNGQWVYSDKGASNYLVHDGDVEGWRWGTGQMNQWADPPAIISFEEVCAPPPTDTPTPTATPTPTPTPTSTPTEVPLSVTFEADHEQLYAGECTFLRWSITGAHSAFLEGDKVKLNDALRVCPSSTRTYRLLVSHSGGETESLVTITVLPARPTATPTRTPTYTPTPRATGTSQPTPTPTLTPTPPPPTTPAPTSNAAMAPAAAATQPPASAIQSETTEAVATPAATTPTTPPQVVARAQAPAAPAQPQAERGATRQARSSPTARMDLARVMILAGIGGVSAIGLAAISIYLSRRRSS